MEAVVLGLAFIIAMVVVARGLGGGGLPDAPASRDGDPPALSGAPQPHSPLALPAALVPGSPPLRIFASRLAEVRQGVPDGPPDRGAYSLTLSRNADGRWDSVLRAPAVASQGGVLTITLVVPWSELASRYAAVNLVVR